VADRGRVVVIGVGNELRRDDGAGLEAARRVREHVAWGGVDVCEESGELLRLLDVWYGCHAAFVIDAIRSAAAPATVRRLDVSDVPLDAAIRRSASSHAVGLGDAIELARKLGQLPSRVIVYAIEGGDFSFGRGLSEPVRSATRIVAAAVVAELDALAVTQCWARA